jgi:hypothetical protein
MAFLHKTLSRRYKEAIEQGFPFWRTQSFIYLGWAKIRRGELEDGLSLLREGSAAYRPAWRQYPTGGIDSMWGRGTGR